MRPRYLRGQSTLEYLVVLLGVVAIIIALGALARAGGAGVLARLALQAASHTPTNILDVLMY